MLLTSILIPFLAFVLPFQDMVMDDFRAIRLDSLPLAVGNRRRGTLTGVVITTLLVGHHIFRSEMFGHPSWLEDATTARPPQYIEKRLSKPYTSSLLRTQCIAQKILAPPAPTCINKAVKPSFEYAEKSPAPPAFPIRRQMCSLQPATVFVGTSMTFLYPPSSANILVFPEPAQSTTAPQHAGSLWRPMVAALIDLAGLLATLLGLLWIWVGMVAMVVFRPSVYVSTAYLVEEGNDNVDLVVLCSALENTQGEEGVIHHEDGALKCLDEISTNDHQDQGLDEDAFASHYSSPSLFVSGTQSSPEASLLPSLPALPAKESYSHGLEIGSIPSKLADSPPLSQPTREHAMPPVPESSHAASGLPLLLHSGPTSFLTSLELPAATLRPSLPAPFIQTLDDTAVPVTTITVPRTLNSKAVMFTPRSLQSSVHAATSGPALSILDVPDVSLDRLLLASMHAAAPRPAFSTLDGSEACSLKASIHASVPQPTFSDSDFSQTNEARSLGPFIHAPVLDIHDASQVRSLQPSVPAPATCLVPRAPGPPKPHSAFNPAAQAFLPGAPNFFMQNYCSGVVITAPPPKKRRVRSPQMLERKRLKREAKEALARAAEEGGAFQM